MEGLELGRPDRVHDLVRSPSAREIWRLVLLSFAVLVTRRDARADLALETETARLLPPGEYAAGSALEFQTSPDGVEYALPVAFEAGVFKDFELMVEPVAYTAILPRGGGSAYGIGDTETTLAYRFFEETPYVPALALAGEVKIPTASSTNIGSGQFDYRIFAVASKRIADVDFHFNIGYTFTGSPSDVGVKNPLDLALAAEWFVSPAYDLFGEVTYVGSSVSADSGDVPVGVPSASSESSTFPELGGKEIVGSAGARFHVTPKFDVFGSVSYDNSHATLLRTGFNFKF